MRRAVFTLALVGALIGAFAPVAQATLCVVVDGNEVARVDLAPGDFVDRGSSLSNPAGKMAAWEAHFNSPVVDGPAC